MPGLLCTWSHLILLIAYKYYHLCAPNEEARFPGSSGGKESACKAGDVGSIPESGRSPGGGSGNPLQYSYMGNPMDRGAQRATVHEVTKESDTT